MKIGILSALFLILIFPLQSGATQNPNIIILLANDMGWRDTGYSGNPWVKTPSLDAMAAKGLRLDYFYAAGPSCCPGRYGILSGRSPLRGGINRNQKIRAEEILLPRALKLAGYHSAHFGKWHIGTGPTSPIGMGFDQATWTNDEFELEQAFLMNDTKELIRTKGDGSLAVMNLALEHIRMQSKSTQPFLVTIGFSSPHKPLIAAPEFKRLYTKAPEKLREYYGEISGIDTAVGRLREELRRLDIAQNTLVWLTSDNAGDVKESQEPNGKGKGVIGTRTVGVLEWPGSIKPMRVTMPCGHVDIYPTLLSLAGVQFPNQPALDGISLVPLLNRKVNQRSKPLGFMRWNGDMDLLPQINFETDPESVWIDGKYKLIVEQRGSKEANAPIRLYDIFADPAEKNNLVRKLPGMVIGMRKALNEWKRSVRNSYDGKDFPSRKEQTQPVGLQKSSDHSNIHRH